MVVIVIVIVIVTYPKAILATNLLHINDLHDGLESRIVRRSIRHGSHDGNPSVRECHGVLLVMSCERDTVERCERTDTFAVPCGCFLYASSESLDCEIKNHHKTITVSFARSFARSLVHCTNLEAAREQGQESILPGIRVMDGRRRCVPIQGKQL
jgi:hypothetical protein